MIDIGSRGSSIPSSDSRNQVYVLDESMLGTTSKV